MTIKEKLTERYPLTKRIDCDLECYEVAAKRYVVFLDELIKKDNIENFLADVEIKVNNCTSKYKTLIVVGYTDETFMKQDLFYFNGLNSFASFYLLNKDTDEIYFNDSWIFTLGLNWRRIVRRFNEILKNSQ